jgi:hypothetical protein
MYSVFFLQHEMMIHAYLFVTDHNCDHDGHGQEFLNHMDRINEEGGTNLTVSAFTLFLHLNLFLVLGDCAYVV